MVAVSAIIAKLLLDQKKKKKKVTLVDPSVKYSLRLKEKIIISHDTRMFRFELPNEEHCLGLPIGQHINLSARINGSLVVRTYTPTSSDEDLGYVDLVIKVYSSHVHPQFPDGGKMSQHLDSLAIGNTIDVKGPTGHIEYKGQGKFKIKIDKKTNKIVESSEVSLIAGGTGITPILQLVRAVFRDPDDNTCLALLYANKTEEDILLRKELEQIAKEHPDRFKLWFTVSNSGDDWKYSVGHINDEMIKHALLPPSNDNLVLMCGPPPMINLACIPNLDKLGYRTDMIFSY